MKQIIATIAIGIVFIGLGVIGYRYIDDRQMYIATDNATLQADLYTVKANQTGIVSDWTLQVGKVVKQGDIVGKIGEQPVVSDANATVVKTSVYHKQTVLQGQILAKLADLNRVYILAYIDEDKIDDVKPGNEVTVTIEALSDQTFTAKVSEIGITTGDNQTTTEKEIGRIPVKIIVDQLPIDRVSLGVHAEIKIKK